MENRTFILVVLLLLFVNANAQQHNKPKQYKVNASSLNVRSAPNTQGVKKGKLERGDTVTVYEVSGDSSWAHVRYHSYNGWVSMKYLQPVEQAASVSDNILPKQNEIARQMLIFIYEQHEKIYWIILSLVMIVLVADAYPAHKRNLLKTHFWRMGFMIAIMLGLKNYWWILRWLYPALISMLFFYALLFSTFSATTFAKVMRWGIWVWCVGAAWVYVYARSINHVFFWWIAPLNGFVNWCVFQLLSKNLEAHECPYCYEYAEHYLIRRDLVSREYRTEYAGEKTIGTGRVTFSSSDISDGSFSIKRDIYDEYKYDTYDEEYECVICRRHFGCKHSTRDLVARDV